nr:hypothetical protein BaRGS_003383 [Batillaria attramentaria]
MNGATYEKEKFFASSGTRTPDLSHWLFGLAIGISSFLNLLLPGAADVHYMVVIAVRVLQGLVECARSFLF